MTISPSKLNAFLMLKLPSAYLCGVRAKFMDATTCVVSVKHRWINQNPFNSMFWAVQGMAAELSTGTMVMQKIKDSNQQISMLVANNTASFSKKATGRITFTCNQGHDIDDALEKAISTKEGQTVWLSSVGINAEGIKVSEFSFEWTLKVRS